MDISRKNWNTRQKELRKLLSDPSSSAPAKDLFQRQHAEVHAANMSSAADLSFEDDVFAGMTDEQLRKLPDQIDQSIAWIIWHLARIEDVTMNILVSGDDQIFRKMPWDERLGISIMHTGNMMSRREITELSNSIDLSELRKYRKAVGRQTEAIVEHIQPEDLARKVSQARLSRIMREGAIPEDAQDLIDYWNKRTISGLLLMPATRHCFIHLNEATRIKKRIV